MSTARGLNGGANSIFNILQFNQRLNSSDMSFVVDPQGNVVCNNLNSSGIVAASSVYALDSGVPVNLQTEISDLAATVATLQSQIAVLQQSLPIVGWGLMTWNGSSWSLNNSAHCSFSVVGTGDIGITYTGSVTPLLHNGLAICVNSGRFTVTTYTPTSYHAEFKLFNSSGVSANCSFYFILV